MSPPRRAWRLVEVTAPSPSANAGPLARWLQALLDLLLPPHCVGCGSLGTWLCQHCSDDLPLFDPPICQLCGRPTPGLVVCSRCWNQRRFTQAIRVPFALEGTLSKAVHRLKYRRAKHLAEPLGTLLAQQLGDWLPQPVDGVTPVPLHPNRERTRGYNHSALLAQVVASTLGLSYTDQLVKRVRDTPPQVGLSAEARQANVKGAFAPITGAPAPRAVLLIDDVTSTGATLEACAQALRRGGVKQVWAAALARPRDHHP